MPTQRQVSVRFWTSSQVRNATPATRLFMLWAMTGPRATLPGIFRLSWDDAVEDTGLTRKQLGRAIAEASAPGPDGEPFLRFDPETRVLWVCKRLAYEFPDRKLSPLQRIGVRRVLDDLPRCALVRDVCEAYKAWGEPFTTLRSALAQTHAATHPGTHAETHPREALSSLLSASSLPLSASGSQLPGSTTSAPVDGKRRSVPQVSLTPQGFVIPPEVLARWKAAYPAVDVEVEVRAAFEWIQANPARRKSNRSRFLVNWLKRTQDRAPQPQVLRPGRSPAARKQEIVQIIAGDRAP